MVELSFNVDHPFDIKFKNFWCRAWSTPFKNKFVELEFHTTESLLGFNFYWTRKRDHAGLDIQLSLAGLCVHFNFYDNRHWDYEKSAWKQYDN